MECQALRCRPPDFMPKLIKTVGADSIYNQAQYNASLERLINSGKYFGAYNALADNGEIYIISGDSEVKEWFAYRCVSPSVSEKTKFNKMLAGYEPTGETSRIFKTKKALTTAIEEGNAGFETWEKPPKVFVKSGQVRPEGSHLEGSSSTSHQAVWFLLTAPLAAVLIIVFSSN